MDLFVCNYPRPYLQLIELVSGVGGYLLSPESLESGADKKMSGSLFIFEADSIEK
jgi:hypothetical protein